MGDASGGGTTRCGGDCGCCGRGTCFGGGGDAIGAGGASVAAEGGGAGICGGSVGLISGIVPISETSTAPAELGTLGVYAAGRYLGSFQPGMALAAIEAILPWSYGQ